MALNRYGLTVADTYGIWEKYNTPEYLSKVIGAKNQEFLKRNALGFANLLSGALANKQPFTDYSSKLTEGLLAEYVNQQLTNVQDYEKRKFDVASALSGIEKTRAIGDIRDKEARDREQALIFNTIKNLGLIAMSFIPGIGQIGQTALLSSGVAGLGNTVGSGYSGMGNIYEAPSYQNWQYKPGNFGFRTYGG